MELILEEVQAEHLESWELQQAGYKAGHKEVVLPGRMELVKNLRPKDMILELAVGLGIKTLEYSKDPSLEISKNRNFRKCEILNI